MNYIQALLNRITMYQAVLYALRFLLATTVVLAFFGVINFIWWHIVTNLILFFVFSAGSNQLLGKIYKVKTNYESQYITAGILTLIIGPLNPLTDWWVIFLIAFAAMSSKYVLAINKRHIFNPAAFGALVGGLLFGQGASWWVGNQTMLPIVLVVGLLVIYKLKWFHLALAFLVTYLATLSLSLLWQGLNINLVWPAVQSTIFNSAVIFFAGIMLIEPLTAPRSKQLRIFYGVLIALVMVLTPIIFPTYGYSIETSLLIGNIFAFLFSKNQTRQALTLTKTEEVAANTHALWFEPYKKFDFKPGQFLEWTLPHPKHDSRGIRRFFTIASSPTQDLIRLVTKSNPKMSTFKQALLKMRPGDEITISSLEGEFTLPQDNSKKFVFIAGGVGITPFLSMLQYLRDTNSKQDIILLYASKTEAEIAFKDELSASEIMGVKTIYVVTENPPPNWAGQTGFITKDMIKSQIPDWQNRVFYISGPEPMVKTFETMLNQMGVLKSQIKRDYFPGYQA